VSGRIGSGASIVIRAGYPLPPAKATDARQLDDALVTTRMD
jgi:hypothetical protein